MSAVKTSLVRRDGPPYRGSRRPYRLRFAVTTVSSTPVIYFRRLNEGLMCSEGAPVTGSKQSKRRDMRYKVRHPPFHFFSARAHKLRPLIVRALSGSIEDGVRSCCGDPIHRVAVVVVGQMRPAPCMIVEATRSGRADDGVSNLQVQIIARMNCVPSAPFPF